MEIIVREARKSDFGHVGQVFTEELTFHSKLLPDMFQVADPIMTAGWYAEILSNPVDPIYKPREYAYINDMVVRSRHQGQGVGKLLMDHANKWIIAQGIRDVTLNVWEANEGAILFYKALGFENFRRTMRTFLGEKGNQGFA